jgi:hypothetical protein
MHPRIAIALSKEEKKDPVVTRMYLEVIYQAADKAGFDCKNKYSVKDLRKDKDFLIVGSCKLALEFWIKGYKNLIIWAQGIVPEEAIMLGSYKYKYYAHSFIEKVMLKRAKFIFMVSEEMLKHFESKYNLSLKRKTYIMPCFNENKIDEQSFQIKDKYLNNTFLYAGSLQEWQCFEQTVKVYKKIEDTISNTKFYIYTKERTKAITILKQNGVRNYIVDFVSLKDLSKKIRNIKYGFVLRKDTIVNRVATPTKLSNYISHGIIPIYSPCLHSFNNYNKNTGLAIPFELENMESSYKKLLRSIKQPINKIEAEQWCKTVFHTYYNSEYYSKCAASKMKLVLKRYLNMREAS